MVDIKGSAYFLNASQVGICELEESCWLDDATPLDHGHAIVIVVEFGQDSGRRITGQVMGGWFNAKAAEFRAYEIAISIANHIQNMGFSAVAHDKDQGDVDLERLTVMSGLGIRSRSGILNPYLEKRYAVCAVTTEYALATDLPLAPPAAKKAKGIAWQLGIGGATSGLERWRQNNRPTHMSKFAMETVDRVDRPTTLIIDDEVPRIPKRASFFERPVHGDLGKKDANRANAGSLSNTLSRLPW